MKFTSVYTNPKKFTTIKSSYSPTQDIILNTVKAAGGHNVDLQLIGITGMDQVVIVWGDGSQDLLTMDGLNQTYNHTYTNAGTYQIRIRRAESLKSFILSNSGDNADVSFNLSSFNYAINLEVLFVYFYGTVTGSVNKLSTTLKQLNIYCTAPLSGDVTRLINLEWLRYFDPANTMTGVLTGMTKMKRFYLNGTGVMSINVTTLTDIEFIEGNGTNKIVSGDITGLIHLQEICSNLGGSLSGDISGMGSHLTYIDLAGVHSLTGSITGLTLMTRFRVTGTGSTLTGNIYSMPGLCNYHLDNIGLDKVTTLIHNPQLCQLYTQSDWIYSSAEINSLLAELWAGRNVFSSAYVDREFRFNGNPASGSPTGQGLIDMAALMSYRSPNDNPIYDQWTIVTNMTLGPERCLDTHFNNGILWVLGLGHTISGSKLNFNVAINTVTGQSISPTVGKTYFIEFNVDAISSGNITCYLGSDTPVYRTQSGRYCLIYTADVDPWLYIQNSIASIGSLTYLSVKEIL